MSCYFPGKRPWPCTIFWHLLGRWRWQGIRGHKHQELDFWLDVWFCDMNASLNIRASLFTMSLWHKLCSISGLRRQRYKYNDKKTGSKLSKQWMQMGWKPEYFSWGKLKLFWWIQVNWCRSIYHYFSSN